jgi:hypothetical protein
MITQTIQRWLNKLFAWWPWPKSSERAYAQAVGDISKGTTQDLAERTTIAGALPQAGSMSIAVEHGLTDTNRLTTDERADLFAQSPPTAIPDKRTALPSISSIDLTKETVLSSNSKTVPLSTPEQNLAFLQYLVKRGTFNEGFSAEQVPDQYRQNL